MISKFPRKIAAFLTAAVIYLCNIQFVIAGGGTPLKAGNHPRWFDRLDLTSAVDENGKNYGEALYRALEAGIDINSNRCCLIDPTKALRHVDEKSDYRYIPIVTFPGSAKHVKKAYQDSFLLMDAVVTAFLYDYPQAFWITAEDPQLSFYENPFTSQTEVRLILSEHEGKEGFDIRQVPYRSPEKLKAAIEERDRCVQKIIASVKDASRYEQIYHINKTLIENNGFYLGGLDNVDPQSPYCLWDGFGALKGLKGSGREEGATSGGFSLAVKVLCQELGIPCVIASGSNINHRYKHLWNMVQMENGKWYALDVSANHPNFPKAYNLFCGYVNQGYRDDAVDGATASDQCVNCDEYPYLLVGGNTMCDARTCFWDSHRMSNKLGATAFTNGPQLSYDKYQHAK